LWRLYFEHMLRVRWSAARLIHNYHKITVWSQYLLGTNLQNVVCIDLKKKQTPPLAYHLTQCVAYVEHMT